MRYQPERANGHMCVAGCVAENDQNNVSYRWVARLQDAHICLFGVKFFPVAVLTVSVSL